MILILVIIASVYLAIICKPIALLPAFLILLFILSYFIREIS